MLEIVGLTLLRLGGAALLTLFIIHLGAYVLGWWIKRRIDK